MVARTQEERDNATVRYCDTMAWRGVGASTLALEGRSCLKNIEIEMPSMATQLRLSTPCDRNKVPNELEPVLSFPQSTYNFFNYRTEFTMSKDKILFTLASATLHPPATRSSGLPIKAPFPQPQSSAPPPQCEAPTPTMSTDSTLLGVALIIRSRDGPRFVFHYPPRFNDQKAVRPPYGTELDPTGPEDNADMSNDEDDDVENAMGYELGNGMEGLSLGKKERHVNSRAPWEGDECFESLDGGLVVPWEYLDAFRTSDLASILTPARPFHKKCFELTLDPLTFVTYPMHIREDGRWKKRKRDRRSKKRREESESAIADDVDTEKGGPTPATATVEMEEYDNITSPGVEEIHKRIAMPRGLSFHSEDNEGGMTMFNLVFIMNPKKTEAPAKVSDMFEHVAKDVNKALRYAQNYSNYVWKESDLILNLKEKAKDNHTAMSVLWEQILLKSSLARMMKEVYASISRNNIAVIQLLSNPPVRLSVQIPKPAFTAMLPEFDEPSQPGLWITTANFLGDQEKEFDDESSLLSKHFALLLLDDEDKTVADIQADGGELAAPLLEYLKIVRPTLSFHQTATTHAISLSDIRILAQHLIYHRRAIAIPPLHPRDTYILSPNSPNGSLPHFVRAWAQKFPLAPPLTNFLAQLGRPRPYKTLVPSKMHRPVYIEMLGWLLRYGWVTQLRTFVWVVAWPEIRYEVEYELEGGRLRKAVEDLEQGWDEVVGGESPAVSTKEPSTSTHPHPQPAPVATSGSATASPSTTKTSTEKTAERARLQRAREKAVKDLADFEKKPKPEATAHPSLNRAAHLKGTLPGLILDPARAEHVDSLLLAAISRRLDGETVQRKETDQTVGDGKSGTAAVGGPGTGTTGGNVKGKGQEEEDKKSFLRWAKYFNGRTSMERIALLEGVKRKEVWARISGWDEYLHVVRTW